MNDQNDLISRSAQIEKCKRIISERWNNGTAPVSWAEAYAEFIDDLEEAPAVTPPERTGRWERYTTSAYIGVYEDGEPKWAERKFFVHKECGRRSAIKERWCPNCGCKMVEGDEHETD